MSLLNGISLAAQLLSLIAALDCKNNPGLCSGEEDNANLLQVSSQALRNAALREWTQGFEMRGNESEHPWRSTDQIRKVIQNINKEVEQRPAERFQVYSDFDPLQSVVIGRADGFRLPTFDAEPLTDEFDAAVAARVPDEFQTRYEGGDKADLNHNHLGVQYPAYMIDAANHALDGLSILLEKRGVKVWRSDAHGLTGQTSKTGNKGYSARDLMIMIGSTLFLTPTSFRSRSHEVDQVYSHVINSAKRQAGTKVVDLRTPAYWRRFHKGPDAFLPSKLEPSTDIPLTEDVPLFDAANCFVLSNKTVVYLVSVSGNRAGASLLQEHLVPMGMKVVTIEGVYYGTHIDTTILPLSHKKILFNENRISRKKMQHYFAPHGYGTDSFIGVSQSDIVPIDAPFIPYASQHIAMNVLSLSAETVLVEASQSVIAHKLKEHGFEVLKVPLPYTRDFSGGLHCVTCPLYRHRL